MPFFLFILSISLFACSTTERDDIVINEKGNNYYKYSGVSKLTKEVKEGHVQEEDEDDSDMEMSLKSSKVNPSPGGINYIRRDISYSDLPALQKPIQAKSTNGPTVAQKKAANDAPAKSTKAATVSSDKKPAINSNSGAKGGSPNKAQAQAQVKEKTPQAPKAQENSAVNKPASASAIGSNEKNKTDARDKNTVAVAKKDTETQVSTNIQVAAPAKQNQPAAQIKKQPSSTSVVEKQKNDKKEVKQEPRQNTSANSAASPTKAAVPVAKTEGAASATPAKSDADKKKKTIPLQETASILGNHYLTKYPLNKERFIWPINGKVLKHMGQQSDKFDEGISISAPLGTLVKATASGEVVYADSDGRHYGTIIVIKHEGGYLSAYSHLSAILIKKGDKVKRGEYVGKVGKTGDVKEPQLFFSMRHRKNIVDPEKPLP